MPRWLVFALLTVVLWGVWGFAARKLGDCLSGEQIAVMSTLGLLPVIVALAWWGRARGAGGGRRGVATALASGILGGVANLAFYQLLGAGEKASTVVPLTALYPLVTIVLAVVVLRERCHTVQFGGILLALAAIYCFNVSAEGRVVTRWLAYALLPIGFWGVSALLQKIATNRLSAEASTLWFLLGSLPVSLWLWATQPMKTGLDFTLWIWTFGLGLALGLGNFTLLLAYGSEGKASVITPLAGLYPLVTVPLAIGFLGEKVTPREWAGIALSLVAVVALSFEKPAVADVTERLG